MTFRGLAVFSLAMIFGSLQACRPSASLVHPTPMPPALSIPAPFPQKSLSGNVTPQTPIVPAPRLEPEPTAMIENPWKPAAKVRDWNAIVIHHTATHQGSVESIHEAHLARQWLGIGYHFVIGNGSGMPDGEIEPTFRWREQLHGAHAGVEEFNQHGIGIAVVGNFEEQPPSPAQLAAVKRLVAVLKTAYHIDGEHVMGHRQVKATACPGKLFPIAEVSRASLADLPRPKTPDTAAFQNHPDTFPAGSSVRPACKVRESHRTVSLAVLSGSRPQ